ncbi:hypothetical protein [Ignavibacterium sp.]|uniref:hypothetical protein n=1 Tax=Ignavibacterium sp. TaxID=2651167 RepID=UPI00307F270F
MISRFLIPHKYKIVGIVLLILGIISAYLRFYLGIKPSYLNLPVFAFYSSFLDTKTFQVITNNISEEIVSLILLLGLLLINFSKEVVENDKVNSIRLFSFVSSVLLNSVILIFSVLFIYGFAFVNVLMFNIFSQMIIYQIIFRILFIKNQKALSTDGII